MPDTSEEIQKRYEKEAESYREVAPLVNFEMSGFFDVFSRMIDSFFRDSKAEIKILDIGAGNGMFTELLLKKFPNAKITMFDFSPEMLKSAQAYFKANGFNEDNIEYIVGDFIKGNLPEGPFDLVVSSYALHHTRSEEELTNVFLKINKTLKSNIGTFLCIDMYLGNSENDRKYQIKEAEKTWLNNFGSKEKVEEWGSIIREEDTPSTVSTILRSLYKCYNASRTIPLINRYTGSIALMYGVTRLSLEEIQKRGLYDLVYYWRNDMEHGEKHEHETAALAFGNKK